MGTARATPGILDVDASWPKPWLFMRMLLASLVLYVLFWLGWSQFENTNLLPGWIMVGSFAIPISTLVLFFEFNVRRNVSQKGDDGRNRFGPNPRESTENKRNKR